MIEFRETLALNIDINGLIVPLNIHPSTFLFRCSLEAIILFSHNGGTITVFMVDVLTTFSCSKCDVYKTEKFYREHQQLGIVEAPLHPDQIVVVIMSPWSSHIPLIVIVVALCLKLFILCPFHQRGLLERVPVLHLLGWPSLML